MLDDDNDDDGTKYRPVQVALPSAKAQADMDICRLQNYSTAGAF